MDDLDEASVEAVEAVRAAVLKASKGKRDRIVTLHTRDDNYPADGHLPKLRSEHVPVEDMPKNSPHLGSPLAFARNSPLSQGTSLDTASHYSAEDILGKLLDKSYILRSREDFVAVRRHVYLWQLLSLFVLVERYVARYASG